MKHERKSNEKEQLRRQRRRPMYLFLGAIVFAAAVGGAWTLSQYRARRLVEESNAANPVYGTDPIAVDANQQLADAGMTEDASGNLGLEA